MLYKIIVIDKLYVALLLYYHDEYFLFYFCPHFNELRHCDQINQYCR